MSGKRRIIGIDPGTSGGLAVIEGEKYWVHSFQKGGNPIEMLVEEVGAAKLEMASVVCALEQVNALPGQGAASMFKFGRAYGEMLGALYALEVRYRLVRPVEWQKSIPGLGTRKSSGGKAEFKRRLKAEATRLFPVAKPTLNTADALLIARWAALQEVL